MWLLAFKERYKLEWLLLAAIATVAYDFFFGGKNIGVWIGEFQAQLTRDYVVPGYVLDLLIGGLLMTTLTGVGAVVVNRSQRKTNLTLKEQTETDPLTGLPNAKKLEAAFNECRKGSKSSWICYVDIVGFRKINSRFNHRVADKLLVNFAKKVRAELRGSQDQMFRIYGDEFVLLLSKTDDEGARTCIARIVRTLADQACIAGTDRHTKEEVQEFVPARFGLTDFDLSAEDETLAGCIERADTAVNLLKHVDPDFERRNAIRTLTRADVDEDPSLLSPRRPFKVRPGGAATARAVH
ncbi:MAG: GGDEF domain-containing protein [Reyranellaceae bacterium]